MIDNQNDGFIKIKEDLIKKCQHFSIKSVVVRNIKKCNTMRGIVWELRKVFKKACIHRIITSDLIEAYPNDFAEFKIYSNCDVAEGFLLLSGDNKANASGDATVVACDDSEINTYNGVSICLIDNAKVNAFNRTSVEANDTSSVVAFDRARVRALKNSKIELHDKSSLFAVEDVYVDAYDNSIVKSFGNVTIKAHDNSTIVVYDSCNVEKIGNKVEVIRK